MVTQHRNDANAIMPNTRLAFQPNTVRLASPLRAHAGLGRQVRRRTKKDDRQRHDQHRLQHRKRDHGPAPAEVRDRAFENRRPDETRQIAAARNQRQRRAAASVEPAADIDVQRRVQPGVAEQAHEQAVTEIELPRRAARRQRKPERDHRRAGEHGPADAVAVGEPAHQQSADRGAEKRQRHRQRRHRAGAAGVAGDLLQPDRGDPRPAVRQPEQDQRDAGHRPRRAGLDRPRRAPRSCQRVASRPSAKGCCLLSNQVPAARRGRAGRRSECLCPGEVVMLVCSQGPGGSEMRKLLVALALIATGAIGDAVAQDFPSRHVTIIVPLAPGGSTDTIARIMAEGMRPHLGQTVIVENSPGAGGSTGVIRVARSTPDGYTVQIGQWGTNVASGAVYDLPIDLLKDLEPVGLIATQPSMIVGRKDLPPNNLKELIAWMKANPGKPTFGNAGIGSPGHVSAVFLQNTVGGQVPVHPVSQRRAGLAGPAGRQHRPDDGHGGDLGRPCAQRAAQGLCDDRRQALAGHAGRADHRRGRSAGIPVLLLARALGAQGHAQARHRQAQRGAGEGGRRCDGHASACSTSARSSPGPTCRRRRRSAKFQKAEIEKWWPVIKAAGIKVP